MTTDEKKMMVEEACSKVRQIHRLSDWGAEEICDLLRTLTAKAEAFETLERAALLGVDLQITLEAGATIDVRVKDPSFGNGLERFTGTTLLEAITNCEALDPYRKGEG